METHIIDGVEVNTGSGNVYADLDLTDAESLKVKTDLTIEIRRAMARLGMNQKEAAKRMGITQPRLSNLLRGDFDNVSERKLMACLNRLGYDIEIHLRPTSRSVGHILPIVAAAF